MSSSKYPQSSLSKPSADPPRVIKPVLQSRKKIEKKPSELRPISACPKSKQSPLKKVEKPKKEPESTLLTYKEQRDLRTRKSDTQRAEKRTLKEIEKIQKTIRKNPSSCQLPEEIKDRHNVVLTNSRTPSLSGNFNFGDLFTVDVKETGSVKDRICKQFVQKWVDKHENIDFELDKVEVLGPQGVEEVLDTLEDLKPSMSEDHNLSFEDPNMFMPEIPFFQYNYSNVDILDSEFSCFNEFRPGDEVPLAGTISVLFEIFLDSCTSNVVTSETFEITPLDLPSIEPVVFRGFGTSSVSQNQQVDNKSKEIKVNKEVKILKKLTLEIIKKPVCGLFFDEKPMKKVEILKKQTFFASCKPLVSSLEVQKVVNKGKKVSYFEFSLIKAKVVSKPLIVLQEISKKMKKVNDFIQKNIKPLVLDMSHSPIISTEGQAFLFDSQRSLESFNLPLSKQESCDFPLSHQESLEIVHRKQNSNDLEPNPSKPSSSEALSLLLRLLASKFKLLDVKTKKTMNQQRIRKQESSLYIIFSLKRKSALFVHFDYWHSIFYRTFQSPLKPTLPDFQTIERFLHYSATFIQRNWRGFYVRKFVVSNMLKYKRFKNLLKTVVIGWKTRKILTTRRMKNHFKSIQDLKSMIFDMQHEHQEGVDVLLARMIEEMPKMHSKMIKDFNSLYRTGTWVALLKNSKKKDQNFQNFSESSRFLNRDDIPIKPLQSNYEDLCQDFDPIPVQPKKIFRNFLKRKTKSVPLSELNEKSVNATEETKEKLENPLKNKEKNRTNEKLEDIDEETMQEEKKIEGKPKEFLKRKSQSIKPKKLQWNVKKKIDCWVSKEVYMKKPVKLQQTVQKDFCSIEELEKIFEDSLRNFVDTSSYLKKFERTSAKTRIPQFRNCSDFLFGVKEENYYEILEELESHYLRLCTQGIRM